MAIPAGTTWEIRSAGSDTTCGGGFSPANKGATGVDYTQQNSYKYTYASLSSSGATVTGTGFTNDILGSVMQVTGTGAGFYCVTGYTNSTTITIDRAPGTPFSGSTGYVGGALATPGTAVTAAGAAGSQIFYLNNTGGSVYTISTGLAPAAGTATAPTIFSGYTTNRTPFNTDAQPTIASSSNVTAMTLAGQTYINNIYFNQTGTQQGKAITVGTAHFGLYNIGTNNWQYGFNISAGNGVVIDCYMAGSLYGVNSVGGSVLVYGCYCLNCTNGIYFTSGGSCQVVNSVANGCSTYGFYLYNFCPAINCTAYNCGIGFYAVGSDCQQINCVATGCATYGFSSNQSPAQWNQLLVNCAGYGNTTANYFSTAYVTTGNAINVFNFIALTSSPFVSTSTPNFSLNTTAGGGAALTATGIPITLPTLAGNAAINVGAYQSAVTAGGGVATPIMRLLGA